MRPVLLDMHGFAAFREPTTVDFRDAEYFALVGPTGSGKSTVIDAMTFALYGSVPRWDDQKVVKLALAPSVNRGTVRLVFDARDARYVVARELRRSAKGGVTVRNARLERLDDHERRLGEAGPGLVHLDAHQASGVLSCFTERTRNDVLLRIATLDGIQPLALRELDDALTEVMAGGIQEPPVIPILLLRDLFVGGHTAQVLVGLNHGLAGLRQDVRKLLLIRGGLETLQFRKGRHDLRQRQINNAVGVFVV